MIPRKSLTKDKWYFGVHHKFELAKWTGCTFASFDGSQPEYMNHIEESEHGFEPLIEVEKLGSGRIWSLKDFNQRMYAVKEPIGKR